MKHLRSFLLVATAIFLLALLWVLDRLGVLEEDEETGP